MKMIPCEIPSKGIRRNGKIMVIVEEFLAMEVPAVRLEGVPEDTKYTSSDGFYKSLKTCVKQQKYPVKVLMHQGQIYLECKPIETP